ncbi:MAG: DUF3187 family protein [bacterium]
MKKSLSIASLIVFFFFARFGFAMEYYPNFGPLKTRTQNPLYLLFLSPTPESSATLEKGHFRFSVETTLSNLIERDFPKNGVNVDMDMEVYRTALNFAYGFHPNFEAGIQLPFLSLNGGFMDGIIQGYHNLFGFPNEGRNKVPNNRYSYKITRGGKTLYSVSSQAFGFSDLNVYLKYQMMKEEGRRPGLSLRVSLKFPTGERDNGLGSGAPDFDFNLALEKSFKRLHSYTNLSYLVLGGFDPLDDYVQPLALTFSQAFEVNITHIASVVAQIKGGTPLFHDTGTPKLDRMPLDLDIGFKGTGPRKGPWRHFEWEFAVSEDLIPSGPSVDFGLRFNLGAKF